MHFFPFPILFLKNWLPPGVWGLLGPGLDSRLLHWQVDSPTGPPGKPPCLPLEAPISMWCFTLVTSQQCRAPAVLRSGIVLLYEQSLYLLILAQPHSAGDRRVLHPILTTGSDSEALSGIVTGECPHHSLQPDSCLNSWWLSTQKWFSHVLALGNLISCALMIPFSTNVGHSLWWSHPLP